ncbi:MAG: DUF6011 domain-containing protein [Anaerolineae bacterium]|nr:DUF6011 domain-containing protein [Anaerolineae bacterium]
MAVNQFSFVSQPRGSYGSARCVRCHRMLTDPESIQAGMGPECRGRSMRGGSGLCRRDEFSDEFDNIIPFEQALVLKRRFVDGPSDMEKVGGVITNVPHLVVCHSPNGFEFGYGGSGPADLALNICQFYLNMMDYEGQQTKCYDGNCWSLAWRLHQDFKHDIVAAVPRTGVTIPFVTIKAWFDEHITDDLRAAYSSDAVD